MQKDQLDDMIRIMFIQAPEPSVDAIQVEQQKDSYANPHNEPYHNKPKIRTKDEIIADLKMKSVLTQVNRFQEIATYLDTTHCAEVGLRQNFEQFIEKEF
jgi:hypothetical protein